MSNYSKTTDFEAKDSLPTGDSGKIIRGAEFETEFDAISTAIATKADTAGPTFTGTLTFETISDGTIDVTAFVDEDDMSSDSATLVPTQQSVKAYVDAQVTAQDLDFQADSGGALSIDLDSETLTFTGGTGIDTSGSGNAVTFAIDSTVATLTGTQTLTNKTLTSPDVNTPDIDGGTIDGTVIGGTTAAAGSFTTVSATGNITVDGTVDGRDVATDGTKLDGIESGATADQTAAEIRTLVDSATDSNVFTDADHTKLDGIEANATADQTAAEIRTLVDSATDSNVFTDADHTKLDGIEAGADVTDTANVTAAGALMDSELTSEASVKALNQGVATTDSPTFAGVTVNGTVEFDGLSGTGSVSVTDILDQDDMSSNSATALATQQSIKAYVDSQVGANNELSEVLSNGNTTGGTDIAVGTGDDITFADNSKAIFGAGSDLQIYHDGGNTFINEGGTGSLYIQARDLYLRDYDTSVSFINMLNNGAVTLHHAGNAKLATTSTGIDVTGTANADKITTDSNVDAASFTSTGSTYVDLSNGTVTGRLQTISSDFFIGTATTGTSLAFKSGNGVERLRINSIGDISFYEDTGTTAKLFWDASAERLGLGTSSPETNLHIEDSSSFSIIRLVASTTENAGIDFGDPDDRDIGRVRYNNSDNSMVFHTNAAEQMRIDSSGNVEIKANAGSLSHKFSYNENGGEFSLYDNAGAQATLIDQSNNTTRMLELINGSNLEIGLGSANTTGHIQFKSAGFANAMRIDSSGNLLVGTTDDSPFNNSAGSAADNGLALKENGQLQVAAYKDTANSGSVVYLNRTSTDGNIIDFRKNGTSVGSIGTDGGDMYLGTGITGVIFNDTNNAILPYRTNAEDDGNIDLGLSSFRFKDLYLSRRVNFKGAAGDHFAGYDGSTDCLQLAAKTFIRFQSGTNYDEAARIDASGNLLVGTTASAPNGGEGVKIIPAYHGTNKSWTAISTAGYQTETTLSIYSTAVTAYRFYVDAAGTISAVNTTITSLSDERAKENIRDLDDGLAKVMQLQPRKFDWKKGQGKDISNDRGFIAQEFEQVFPDMIEEWKDEAPEGEEPYKAVNANLIPTLVKAIQEQNELINDLRARVAQLEGEN